MYNPRAVVLLTLSLALICLPTLGYSRTWNVPLDAATIQAGIDSASVGDTVLVECGTYYEYGLSPKSGVVLLSETGQADCVTIDAQDLAPGFMCFNLDTTTVIQGFAVIHGSTALSGGGVATMPVLLPNST